MESCGCSSKRCNLTKDDHRHGTNNGYNNLWCKCDLCREAHKAYARNYSARKKIKPTEEHKARIIKEANARSMVPQVLLDAVIEKGLSLLFTPKSLFVDEDPAVHGQTPT